MMGQSNSARTAEAAPQPEQPSSRNLSDEELDDENEADEEEEWSTDLEEDDGEEAPQPSAPIEPEAPVAEVKPAPPFEPKLLELLQADSPHSGTFWPLVFHWLEREDWARLATVSKFFKSMAVTEEILYLSDLASDNYNYDIKYINSTPPANYMYQRPFQVPQEFQLDLPVGTIWYQWGAKYSYFGSKAQFDKFCQLGGCGDPSDTLRWRNDMRTGRGQRVMDLNEERNPHNAMISERYYWYSKDRDVLIITSCPHDNYYSHYLGVTGERTKVRDLLEWYRKEVDKGASAISDGLRDYI